MSCRPALAFALAFALPFALACEEKGDETGGAKTADKQPAEITVYSGRGEPLVGPILERYQKETGAKLNVRYGKTAELAALLLEEGDKTPAALFFAQDAGALGALAKEGKLATLPDAVLQPVPAPYQDPEKRWVAVTGRARTVVYNTEKVKEEELPASVFDLTDEKWKGRIGWAPTNGSFQAFVTAMRVKHGDEKTKAWLEGIKKNEPKVYPKNTPIVRAAGAGEIDVGLVNHYYLHRFLAEDEDFPAENHYSEAGDVGSLINVAGLGVLKARPEAEQKAAHELAQFLLSEPAQKYFSSETHEYPMVEGVPSPKGVPPLSERNPPKIDLGALRDLEGTLKLLREAGVLP